MASRPPEEKTEGPTKEESNSGSNSQLTGLFAPPSRSQSSRTPETRSDPSSSSFVSLSSSQAAAPDNDNNNNNNEHSPPSPQQQHLAQEDSLITPRRQTRTTRRIPLDDNDNNLLGNIFIPPATDAAIAGTTAAAAHVSRSTTAQASQSSLSPPPVSLSGAPPPVADKVAPILPAAAPSTSLSNLFAPPPGFSETPDSETTLLLSSSSPSFLSSNPNKSHYYYHQSDPLLLQQPEPQQQAQADEQRRQSLGGDAFLQAKHAAAINDTTKTHTSFLSRHSASCCCCWPSIAQWCHTVWQPTTIAGAGMFLLYHVVFCLAFGSAMIRPNNNDKPLLLGVMAKLAAVGILCSGPFYIWRLGGANDIPALYPSIDLFLAPFLAQAVLILDASLTEQYDNKNDTYPDTIFLGSFCVLTTAGMLMAGCFLWLAARFKLANLGTYLPYSVLCGFFSAVGVLLWCLAFSVDTSGQTWKAVLLSGNVDVIWNACWHHWPSLMVGILMNRLGPKNPFFVILLIVTTQVSFIVIMWVTGTSLQEAQAAQWFWSREELVYQSSSSTTTTLGLDSEESSFSSSSTAEVWQSLFLPPAPFGAIGAVWATYVNWTAVSSGLGNMAALAFLYLLRSSIHASAMKKNVGNLVRRIPIKKSAKEKTNDNAHGGRTMKDTFDRDDDQDDSNNKGRRRYSMASNVLESVRESVRIMSMSLSDAKTLRMHPARANKNRDAELASTRLSQVGGTFSEREYVEIRAPSTKKSLEDIFVEYGYALFIVACCGGFGVCPTVATSNTMYAIGAGGTAPQYGSILLLIIFYFTNFELVQYLPKTVFSSLLVLAAVDTLAVWFIGAYRKTQDLAEWLVVPLIVLFSLFVGFLNAVFLGIGISMFVFVASFFRVGVVKFNATGLEIRSRIERSIRQSNWLDSNGDYIQVLVLQNYLFFGNATSVLNYIATMFEEVDESQSLRLDFPLPPMPKVLVLDLSLVTGMDTSAGDIFSDTKELCTNNDCKLFLCGLSPRMKKGLALAGVKPDTVGPRSASIVRVFLDLDTALGQAEDTLIRNEMVESVTENRPMRSIESGFHFALTQIDELFGQDFTPGLLDLQPFTIPLELKPGECLFQCDGGVVKESHRGLFFIESGLLKVERDSSQSLTVTRTRGGSGAQAVHTLRNQHARMGTMAKRASIVKGALHEGGSQNLRLARFGPGWVCGTVENASGLKPSGVTIAVTECRLHHLSFLKLKEVERDHPVLALRLYKLLSHLLAQKEEITIEQLTTLHNIMSSPAHSKPLSRTAMHAFGR